MANKSVEALWTVEFISNLQIFGSGVVVFETGRIFGGDARYYYLGSFDVEHGGLVKADVKVTHFTGSHIQFLAPERNSGWRFQENLSFP